VSVCINSALAISSGQTHTNPTRVRGQVFANWVVLSAGLFGRPGDDGFTTPWRLDFIARGGVRL